MLIYGKNYNHETINELPWFVAAWRLMEDCSDRLMGKTPPPYQSKQVSRSQVPLRPAMPLRRVRFVRDTRAPVRDGAGERDYERFPEYEGGPAPWKDKGVDPKPGSWLLKGGGRNDY